MGMLVITCTAMNCPVGPLRIVLKNLKLGYAKKLLKVLSPFASILLVFGFTVVLDTSLIFLIGL